MTKTKRRPTSYSATAQAYEGARYLEAKNARVAALEAEIVNLKEAMMTKDECPQCLGSGLTILGGPCPTCAYLARQRAAWEAEWGKGWFAMLERDAETRYLELRDSVPVDIVDIETAVMRVVRAKWEAELNTAKKAPTATQSKSIQRRKAAQKETP